MPPIKITLKFRGLICHVGPDQNDKTHAAVINDPTVHKPLLTIGGSQIPLKKGDVISFKGLPPGPADSSGKDFNGTVPHLEEVTDGVIDHFIQNRLDHNDVVAYVVYPEGTLTVDEWFPDQAQYQLKTCNKTHCVADITSLQSTSPIGKVEVYVNTKLEATLTADTTIRITNLSNGGKHFHLHKKMTDATNIATVTRKTPCLKPLTSTLEKSINEHQLNMHGSKSISLGGAGIPPPSTPDPECSNSQWP
jgi:hypothetical protein